MKELIFVGLGLNSEKGISLSGLEETQSAEHVFIETYTSLMPEFSLENLQKLTGKKIQALTRKNLEDENAKQLLDAAQTGKTVFMIPGDPFIATTHVTIRIEAAKKGIQTRIVHGASIISAIIGLSGLHNYKFGKTVTIPFKENYSETPYNVIAQNRQLQLHTLCLLDLKMEENQYLTINEALNMLLQTEQKRQANITSDDTLAVGVARAGSNQPTLKADYIRNLKTYDFGKPPHTLIFPAQLHFMEAEALIALANAPKSIRSTAT